jgi:hypothetical protein
MKKKRERRPRPAHRGPYAVRSKDPLVIKSEARTRTEIRRALVRFVELIGADDVRKELREAEREVAASCVDKVTHDEAQTAYFLDLLDVRLRPDLCLPIWLAVESIRQAEDPPMAAKAACAELAKQGGLVVAAPGSVGLSGRVVDRIRSSRTIYLKYSLVERLRKAEVQLVERLGEADGGQLNAVWQDQLADLMRRPRPGAAAWGGGKVWLNRMVATPVRTKFDAK